MRDGKESDYQYSLSECGYAKITRKEMLAAAEGVYEYGLCRVCPLITPGVGVGDDILLRGIVVLEELFCGGRGSKGVLYIFLTLLGGF